MSQIHRIITVDEKKLLQGSFFQKVREVFHVWKNLKRQSFDLVITGNKDLRYRLFSLWVKAKKRKTFSPIPGRYHGEEYAKLIMEDTIPIFPKLECLLKPLPNAYIVLAPGGAKDFLSGDTRRRWPIAHYLTLAKDLIHEEKQVVLTGSEDDRWASHAFEEVNCLDLIGKLDLIALLALFSHATAIVTHDSGSLHLAQLVDAPLIAFFGPTNPHEKIKPSTHHHLIWGGESLPCRPCYDGRHYTPCTRHHLCLTQITPKTVLKIVLEICEKQKSFE